MPSTTLDRVLRSAVEELETVGPAELSLEQVAERAGVSRATAYRLFSGKASLLEALAEAYSPFREIPHLLAAQWARPPAIVLPAVARMLLSGDRSRSIVGCAMAGSAFWPQGRGDNPLADNVRRDLLPLLLYLSEHADGSASAPSGAVGYATLVAPLMALLARPFMEELLGMTVDPERVAARIVELWLATNRPPPPAGSAGQP